MAEVEVDFPTKTARLTMAPGKSLAKDACDTAFEGTNYRVKEFAALK